MKLDYFDYLVTFVIGFQDGTQEERHIQSTQPDQQMAVADGMCRLAQGLSKHEDDYFFVVSANAYNRGYCGTMHEDGLLHYDK